MYTEPLVLSLSFSDHGNSASYIQKFFFSATLKQIFLSYSNESLVLSSMSFEYITISLWVGICLEQNAAITFKNKHPEFKKKN